MQNHFKNNYDKSFMSSFQELADPREESGNHTYPLDEILFLAISAIICGITSFTGIEEFGKDELKWLRNYLPYKEGIPSHDTLGRVFSKLEPEKFTKCFVNWATQLAEIKEGIIINIDGKSLRGSKTNSQAIKHIVSAFAGENRLTLGQVTVPDKSNEITAIPELLDLLALKGAIVTIDAIACQKAIAEKIIEKESDYVLQVKKNQPKLHESIEILFNSDIVDRQAYTEDVGHGRYELRLVEIITDIDLVHDKEKWKDLKSIVRVSTTTFNKRSEKESCDVRYYISSLDVEAQEMGTIIRTHWAIENNLHWNLDVLYREDNDLKNQGYSQENFNIMRKIAMNLLEKISYRVKSKVERMNKSARSRDFRESVLFQ